MLSCWRGELLGCWQCQPVKDPDYFNNLCSSPRIWGDVLGLQAKES
jgi:hypothetical protein